MRNMINDHLSKILDFVILFYKYICNFTKFIIRIRTDHIGILSNFSFPVSPILIKSSHGYEYKNQL